LSKDSHQTLRNEENKGREAPWADFVKLLMKPDDMDIIEDQYVYFANSRIWRRFRNFRNRPYASRSEGMQDLSGKNLQGSV
jgi:hypothetical protein